MRANKHSKQRSDFIDRYTELLRTKAQRLQDGYYALMIDEFLTELETKNGEILQTSKNYALARSITRKHKKYFEKETKGLVLWMVKRVIDLQKLNEKYFKALVPDRFKSSIAKASNNIRLRALGFIGNKIVKDSFLHDLITNIDPATAVKQAALRAINSKQPLTNFKSVFRELIKGRSETDKDKGSLGVIDKFVSQKTSEIFALEDRETGQAYAEKLDLKYVIFQGPELTTSRDFCKARKGKVFTTEEVESWKDLPAWRGRNKNYDPFRDVGGHNCVDTLDYISEELAFELRPELRG